MNRRFSRKLFAIVNGVRITARDIEKATGDSVRKLQRQVVEARKRELDLLINSRLLAIEAKKRGIATTKLLEQEVITKVIAPTDADAQAFYEQNRARIQSDFKDTRAGYPALPAGPATAPRSEEVCRRTPRRHRN